MKIAVVDDSEKDLSAEIDYLNNYVKKFHGAMTKNLKIIGFKNANDFLNAFEPENFDLILLDIIMNDINGIELAKIIRAKDKNCNIIFITNSKDFLIEGYSVFAVGYFIKPLAENVAVFKKTFEFIFAKFEKNLELPVTVAKNIRQIRKLKIEIENRTNQIETFDKSFSSGSITLGKKIEAF